MHFCLTSFVEIKVDGKLLFTYKIFAHCIVKREKNKIHLKFKAEIFLFVIFALHLTQQQLQQQFSIFNMSE